MKRMQKGEAMLAVMVAMMLAVWMLAGHGEKMGMKHGGDHSHGATAHDSSHAVPAAPPAAPAAPASQAKRTSR